MNLSKTEMYDVFLLADSISSSKYWIQTQHTRSQDSWVIRADWFDGINGTH